MMLRKKPSVSDESACRFEPDFAELYIQKMSIEDFNALVGAQVVLLRMRYRFSPNSHDKWVSLRSWYAVGPAVKNEGEGSGFCPLNSWALKDPTGFVPAIEFLEEHAEWHNLVASIRKNPMDMTPEKLRSFYIRETCKDMVVYERLLLEWFRSGCQEEQEDWSFKSEAEKKNFRDKTRFQRDNMIEARRKHGYLLNTGAPDFLISKAEGKYFQEQEILNQMHQATVVCR